MRALAMVVLAALAGCAMVGPDYQRPDVALPVKHVEPDVAGAALAVPAEWWQLYRDPLLDELVRAGLERNADLRAATARVDEAEALLREAHATLAFPLVEGNGGASRGRSEGATSNHFTLGLSTSFEIDVWGRLRRAERSVRDQLLASRYGRDTVALSIAGTIARTYFGVRSLDAQLVASQETLRAAEQSVELARKRAEGGVASQLDVYQAGTLRTLASAQAKEVERQRATLVHLLGVLTGRLDLAIASGDIHAIPIPPAAPAGLPSSLLERRPDVRQAEALLAAATERIGVARAAQFPTLRLTASLGTASPELSDLFSAGSKVWSLGLGLLGPILDGGRYAARTEQAEAQARQAAAAYERSAQTAFREVSDALSNVRYAAATEVDLAARVHAARDALRLANLRYERGYSAYLEVLDTQRTLNEAQLAWIRNRQAYLGYTVDLMNALGGGWS